MKPCKALRIPPLPHHQRLYEVDCCKSCRHYHQQYHSMEMPYNPHRIVNNCIKRYSCIRNYSHSCSYCPSECEHCKCSRNTPSNILDSLSRSPEVEERHYRWHNNSVSHHFLCYGYPVGKDCKIQVVNRHYARKRKVQYCSHHSKLFTVNLSA